MINMVKETTNTPTYFSYLISVTRWVKMDEIEEVDDENGILLTFDKNPKK